MDNTARKAAKMAENKASGAVRTSRPSLAQRRYLLLGEGQAGGKLPLFDREGQAIDAKTIRACIDNGWAEPWFANPMKPDWLVCRLTDAGRKAIASAKRAPKSR